MLIWNGLGTVGVGLAGHGRAKPTPTIQGGPPENCCGVNSITAVEGRLY